MIRVLLYLVVGGYLLYKIQQFFSKKPPAKHFLPQNEPHEELVEDPVCHTFVTRQEAHVRTFEGKKHFFCSQACAEKFAQRGDGDI